jgi:hypothetical protein
MKKRSEVILGCDKDGIINNFTKEYIRLYNSLLKNKRTHFKPVDENWEPEIYSFGENKLIDKEVHKVIRDSKFGEIMGRSEMYEGGKQFILDLGKLFPNFTIVTHQYSGPPMLSTFEWLVKNDLPVSCVFADGLEKWRYCDILIDDKIENLEKMDDMGKVAICLARAWNKTYDGLRFENYDSILNYLKENYE